jgi:hypothetical protein
MSPFGERPCAAAGARPSVDPCSEPASSTPPGAAGVDPVAARVLYADHLYADAPATSGPLAGASGPFTEQTTLGRLVLVLV